MEGQREDGDRQEDEEHLAIHYPTAYDYQDDEMVLDSGDDWSRGHLSNRAFYTIAGVCLGALCYIGWQVIRAYF
jgi:hypothetical protein